MRAGATAARSAAPEEADASSATDLPALARTIRQALAEEAPGCSISASSGTDWRVDNREVAQAVRRNRRPVRDQGRERVQDSCIPHRRPTPFGAWRDPVTRHARTRSSASFPASASDLAAKIGELALTGALPLSSGAARGVSADDPRPAAPSGRRPEDGGAPLHHPQHSRASRSWRKPPVQDGCAGRKALAPRRRR